MKNIKKLIRNSLVLLLILVIQLTGFPVVVVAAEEASNSAEILGEATSSATEALPSPLASIAPVVSQIVSPSPSPIVDPELQNLENLKKEDAKINKSLDQKSDKLNSAQVKLKAKIRQLRKSHFKARERITLVVDNAKSEETKVELLDFAGTTVDLPIETIRDSDPVVVRVEAPSHFVPGKYTLKVTDKDGKVTEQDFTWGVLALNTNKSIYKPGEKAEVAIAVLDEAGNMVCNASVKLEIRNPKSETQILSTDEGTIKVNPECLIKAKVLNPDYETSFALNQIGKYELNLQATTDNGSFSIQDSLEVKEDISFDVERSSATRIYPPETYPVNLSITAESDFTGIVTEVVPQSFDITPIEDAENKVIPFKNIETVNENVIKDQEVLGVSTALGMPYEGDHQLSLRYGEKPDDPVLDQKYKDYGVLAHDGIDFDMPEGTPILAVDDGIVVLAQENHDYGTTVVIEHSWGKSYYGHLSQMSVKEGTKVDKGNSIGLSGSTGLSTGPHLHFGIKPALHDSENGYFGKVNPAPFLGLEGDPNILGISTSNPNQEEVTASMQVKVISWEVSVKKGEKVTLGYNFKAPNISPQFYTLGPLKFLENGQDVVFQEARVWQIAADSVSFGTASEFDADTVGRLSSARLTSTKFVMCYNDGQPGQCRVVTNTGTTIDTWGTEAQFVADAIDGSLPDSQIGTCRLADDKFAVVYTGDTGVDDGFVVAGSVSGTTITFGTPVEFDTTDSEWAECAGIATDKFVIGYNDEGNSDTGQATVCTASGITLTCGTNTEYNTTDYYAKYNSPAKLNTDKFVMAYLAEDDAENSGYAVAATVSTTTPTFGTPVEFSGADSVMHVDSCSPQDASDSGSTDKFVIVYRNVTDTSGEAIAGTVSSTTITLGSATDFNPSSEDVMWPGCTFVDDEHFVVAYEDVDESQNGNLSICTVNWTTRAITCSTDETFAAVQIGSSAVGTDTEERGIETLSSYGSTGTPRIMIGYVEDGDGDDGMAIVGDVTIPIDAPTLHTPFDNEKTGDTTPLFEFTGVDDASRNLIYQIQVDDTFAFSSLVIDCESDTSCATGAGSFSNTEDGGDTDPFTEGQRIRFTPTTTLSNSTTYYWRVRADNGGGYSDWSSIWSLTIVTGTDPSEWFQTTDEQFETGTLSGVQGSNSGSVQVGYGSITRVGVVAGDGGTPATSTTSIFNLPAGVQDGDVAIVAIHREAAGAVTLPSGEGYAAFDAQDTESGAGSTLSLATFYTVLQAADASQSHTFTFASTWRTGQMIILRGVDTTEPRAITNAAAATEAASGTTLNTPSESDPNVSNMWVVWFASSWDNSTKSMPSTVDGYTVTREFGSANQNLGMFWAEYTTSSAISAATVTYSNTLETKMTKTLAVKPLAASSGTIMSDEIDYDSVSGQSTWGDASFSTTETNGDVKLKVYYTASTACDTIIPNGDLANNSSGFDVSASPVDLSGLNTTTYNKICLQATLTYSSGSPTLNDWTVSWSDGGGVETADLADLMRHGKWFNNAGVRQPFTF